MKTYVEFYYPGFDVSGKDPKEVTSRTIEAIGKIPEYAISYRFFDKDDKDNKVNYSPYYFLGKEYTSEEFKRSFPQVAADPEYIDAERIVKVTTGGFYPLKAEDIVVPA